MKKKMIIKEQKGTALVEFAIVLIVLVLLGVGTGEFGLLLYNKQVVTNASREGARAGIVRDGINFLDNAGIKQIVKDYCSQHLIDFKNTALTDDDIELNPSDDDIRKTTAFGSDFSVKVTYNYGFLVPSLFNLGNSINITGMTLMKMEQEIGAGS